MNRTVRFCLLLLLLCGSFGATLLVILSYYDRPHVNTGIEDELGREDMLKEANRLIVSGNCKAAERQLRRILALFPEDRDAMLLLGNTLLIDRHNYEAWNVFSGILRKNSRDAAAHNGMGMALMRLDMYPDALKEFKTAYDIKNDLPYIEMNIAQVCRLMGDAAQAEYYENRIMSARESGYEHGTIPLGTRNEYSDVYSAVAGGAVAPPDSNEKDNGR